MFSAQKLLIYQISNKSESVGCSSLVELTRNDPKAMMRRGKGSKAMVGRVKAVKAWWEGLRTVKAWWEGLRAVKA